MPKKDDTDLRLSVRLNDDEWRQLRALKIMTGLQEDSKAMKLAIEIARNVIHDFTGGKFIVDFKRATVDDIRKINDELHFKGKNVRQQF